MFHHELGSKVKSKITGLVGILTSRSESYYGCNRYLIQPQAKKDAQSIPDSYWVDEEDVEILEPAKVKKTANKNGGPVSKHS